MPLIAVNYHYIRPAYDHPFPGIHGITPDHLSRQLELLAGAGAFVSGAELRAAVQGEAELPERAFIVTLDDGLREQAEWAWPVFQRLGVPALFFVNTDPIAEGTVSRVHKIHLLRAHTDPVAFEAEVRARAAALGETPADVPEEQATGHYQYDGSAVAKLKYLLNFTLAPAIRDAVVDALFAERFDERAESGRLYMSREQIAELGAADAVGSHAHEHVPLGLLDGEEAADQIRQAQGLLADWAGSAPYALSYPYGSAEAATPGVAAAAAAEGVAFAFTTERAANPTLERPLLLARYDNNDLPGGKAARLPLEGLFDHAAAARRYL